jgi:23S rRNA (guanosine2251-2'-O)-methyltransferase
MMESLEGRNPVLECLVRKKRRVHYIWLDLGAKDDKRIRAILALAEESNIPVERVERRRLDRKAEGRVHNGIIASVEPIQAYTTINLLEEIWGRGEDPFLILANTIAYEHNLGAILRSSLGFGVHGVIVPTRGGAGLSPVAQRVSMGACEDVPFIQQSLTSALKPIKKAGIRVVGADAGGRPLSEVDLTGPIALIMGSEGQGLTGALKMRCDEVVSIPLAGNLESLNVSVATAVLLYEKRRQDGWFSTKD